MVQGAGCQDVSSSSVTRHPAPYLLKVVTPVMGLRDQKAMFVDQIGVDLAARSRGIGRQLASAMMAENPKTRFLAAIMHRPSKKMPSLRLALRNGWHLTTEVWDSEYLWGIYEIHSP